MLVAILVSLTSRVPVSAQLDEGLVKAATLLKVALFVDWPTAPVTDHFVIGVAADDEFVQKVTAAARGRRLNNRDVLVRRLTDSDEACACQMLFVGVGEDVRSTTFLRGARSKPVLTVGETTAFLREGGIVRVFRSNDRLRLQINNKGAEDAGLKISSRLLQLVDHTP
jgi:hypothetical protein